MFNVARAHYYNTFVSSYVAVWLGVVVEPPTTGTAVMKSELTFTSWAGKQRYNENYPGILPPVENHTSVPVGIG